MDPISLGTRDSHRPRFTYRLIGNTDKIHHKIPTASDCLGDTKFAFGLQHTFLNAEIRASPKATSAAFTFTTTLLEVNHSSSRELLYTFQATASKIRPFNNDASTNQVGNYGLKFTHTVTSEGIAQGIRLATIGL